MISSMTGFGHYEHSEDAKRVSVEIKSVNHRYLDLSIKTSRGITALEPKLRDYIKPRLGRGKIDVYVHYHESADDNYNIRYNEKLAMGYIDNLRRLRDDYAARYGEELTDDLTLTKVAMLPDVFELVPEEKDAEEQFAFIRDALDAALEAFLESRRVEGENLKNDLLDKLSEMTQYVAVIEEKAPTIIEEYKARLTAKVAELLEDRQIDEARIATEVTIFADKICVDEELVRLKSHIKEMRSALSSDDAVGRKLDFLAQEMNREANTILSKSTDAAVAEIGIALKTLIEKVREQIQNLE